MEKEFCAYLESLPRSARVALLTRMGDLIWARLKEELAHPECEAPRVIVPIPEVLAPDSRN